jgi:LEA14-like dessication related protein
MTTLRPGLVLIALVSFLFAGCASSAFKGGIGVSLVDFRPTDASLLESRGTLTVRYTNETIAPLGYSGSTHKVYLNGNYVGKAVSNVPFGIPPLNSITQEVPVQFENLALVRQILAVRDSRVLTYKLESVLFQTVDEDKFQIKLQAQGSLDLNALAAPAK